MRRKDKEILDNTILEEIISKSAICRIAMFDNPFPYIIPLNYGYANNSLYFHGANTGKKIELLKNNNHVGFEIEYYHEIVKHEQSCKWTTKYRSIVGTGIMESISDLEQKIKSLDIIMKHNGKMDNQYEKKHLDNLLILKLTILTMTGKQSGDWD